MDYHASTKLYIKRARSLYQSFQKEDTKRGNKFLMWNMVLSNHTIYQTHAILFINSHRWLHQTYQKNFDSSFLNTKCRFYRDNQYSIFALCTLTHVPSLYLKIVKRLCVSKCSSWILNIMCVIECNELQTKLWH